MTEQYTLYDYLPSGNGYKVRLTAKYLGISYRSVQMEITQGASPTNSPRAMKPSRYAYTHAAQEGGAWLQDYPGMRAWLARVAAQPRHAPITAA